MLLKLPILNPFKNSGAWWYVILYCLVVSGVLLNILAKYDDNDEMMNMIIKMICFCRFP